MIYLKAPLVNIYSVNCCSALMCNPIYFQRGNMTSHLEKVAADINRNKKIPQDFHGLGVLDFEEWFAIWDMNFKNGIKQIYRDESVKAAEEDHPQEDPEEAAIEDYNRYAKYAKGEWT